MNAIDKPVVTVFGAEAEDNLPGLSGIREQAELRFATSEEELAGVIADTDILIGWDFRAGVLKRVWPRAQRLRWVHWAGAGVDAALFPEFCDSDVVLTNARGIFDRPMAEYVLGLVLCFAKGFPHTVLSQSRRRWDFRLTESIHDKTALLVGVGNIGRRIATLLSSAGMHLIGVGRTARTNDAVFGVIHPLGELGRLLDDADYVINITPSTPDTRGLFSKETFARMKPTARFINVGRGDAVDQDALVDALRNKTIGGAALDVFAEEPLPESSPLWELDNVIVSPHMSGDVADSHAALVAQFAENLSRFMRGEELNNVVDKFKGY